MIAALFAVALSGKVCKYVEPHAPAASFYNCSIDLQCCGDGSPLDSLGNAAYTDILGADIP
jgi:hypothetical protein|eukprot:4866388-Prymnesium_polylepis.3